MTWGLPRHAIILSRVLIMRLEDSEVSISMSKALRVQSSMTLKVRNLRTPMMLSLIKSMLQLWLTAICRLVAGPSLFLRTGPSKAGYPSLDQRTSSWGANAPLPGFLVSVHRTHPNPRIWPSTCKRWRGRSSFLGLTPVATPDSCFWRACTTWTSMNRYFFMVFEIKGISLLSKVCILWVLTIGCFICEGNCL